MTTIDAAHSLDTDAVRDVHALVDRAHAHDRVAPLNEAALLALDDPESDTVHVRALDGDGRPVGYLLAEVGGGPVHLEAVVDPAFRQQGVATAMLHEFLAGRPGPATEHPPIEAWAHGDLPGASALAEKVGFVRVRELLKLAVDLPETVERPEAPEGVTLRRFRPGQDDTEWLALNARAFVDHPEQGRMTQRDLDQRKAASWFDPDGFFIAERDEKMIGFHWTKVHDQPEHVGEVYVVGVSPDAQGLGLGSVLTQLGLHHLASRGLRRVELYVEGDNAPALRVYGKLGFTPVTRDVMYRLG